jgi:outer membrane receptor protein involved in Fe transport
VLVLVAASLCAPPALAQSPPSSAADAPGRIEGHVRTTDGVVVPGAPVSVTGADGVRPAVTTSDAGAFSVEAVPPGTYVLESSTADGLAVGRSSVTVAPGGTARVDIRLDLAFSEDVIVTESRSGQLKRETPATIGTVTGEALARTRPSHPSEILGTVPGVWVSITGGEGHQTAIRQPLTTNAVYLYLEDGVPTRSTGFFNHNALYEINMPAAAGIEVTKGPGSALYGSDAIGGVINVLTKSALESSGVQATLEAGGGGWKRALVDANVSRGQDGLRLTANLTGSDGWRASTGYDRQSATLRWDRLRGSTLLKTLVSVNRIDQQTAGSSALPEIDFLTDASANLTPVSFRAVEAIRVSTDYQRLAGGTTVSVVPYFRYDSMELLPNWSLTYDPTVYTTANTSWGVLAKVQREFVPWRTTVAGGVDVDLSPGDHVEDVVRPDTAPSGLPSGRAVFTDYAAGPRIYDYDVTFLGLSPYVQAEFSPSARLRVSTGLRLDRMRYDYDDRLSAPDTARHRRPGDAVRTFTHASPKVGVTYQVDDAVNVFASYRHAFRAPSEGQLFRQGTAANTVDLQPVRADNVEAGLRIAPRRGLSVDLSVYQLDKRDDILTFRDPVDGATQAVNAGHTRHRGVELGVNADLAPWLGVQVAYSVAKHTYEAWVVDPAAGVDYSGLEQEAAPRHFGTAVVRLGPVRGVTGAVEVTERGAYWMDAADTTRSGGHTLVNLRGQVDLGHRARFFVRALNLLDRLYAESASYTAARGREMAPGRPRTLFAGFELEWRK